MCKMKIAVLLLGVLSGGVASAGGVESYIVSYAQMQGSNAGTDQAAVGFGFTPRDKRDWFTEVAGTFPEGGAGVTLGYRWSTQKTRVGLGVGWLPAHDTISVPSARAAPISASGNGPAVFVEFASRDGIKLNPSGVLRLFSRVGWQQVNLKGKSTEVLAGVDCNGHPVSIPGETFRYDETRNGVFVQFGIQVSIK